MIIPLATIFCMSILLELIIFLVTFGLLGPITGKYFDAQFQKKHKPVPWVFAFGYSRRCHRGAFYALYLILDPKRLLRLNIWRADIYKERFKQNWGLIDYRKLARKRDWVLSVIYYGNMLLFLISMLSAIILGALMKHYGMD